MSNLFKNFIIGLIVLIMPLSVMAQTATPGGSATVKSNMLNKMTSVGNGIYDVTNTNENTALETIGSIISVLLSLLGIIFVILVIKSGFEWMTAEGDSKKVDTAKSRIKTAVIGLIVIVCARVIWGFIASSFIGM